MDIPELTSVTSERLLAVLSPLQVSPTTSTWEGIAATNNEAEGSVGAEGQTYNR